MKEQIEKTNISGTDEFAEKCSITLSADAFDAFEKDLDASPPKNNARLTVFMGRQPVWGKKDAKDSPLSPVKASLISSREELHQLEEKVKNNLHQTIKKMFNSP